MLKERPRMPPTLIVLAAGQGTRMNSERPKVLHTLGGVPLLWHALSAGRALEPARIVVVVGTGGAEVATAARASPAVQYAGAQVLTDAVSSQNTPQPCPGPPLPSPDSFAFQTMPSRELRFP